MRSYESFDRKEDYDKLIEQLKKQNKELENDKENLYINYHKDHEQYDPIKQLMTDYKIKPDKLNQLVKSRGNMLKTHVEPLKEENKSLKDLIKSLEEQLKVANELKDEAEEKLNLVEMELNDELFERQTKIDDLETELKMLHRKGASLPSKSVRNKLKVGRPKKRSPHQVRNVSKYSAIYQESPDMKYDNYDEYIRATDKLVGVKVDNTFSNNSNYTVSYLYTGTNHKQTESRIALLPGPSTDAININYKFRGIIYLSPKKKVKDYLLEFANNKQLLFTNRVMYTFSII